MNVILEKTRSSPMQMDSLARFEALFEAYWPRIVGVLFRMVGDSAEAEDLALEVFTRLHNRPRLLAAGEDHNLGGWLYRVATNLGYNALRAARRRQAHELAAGGLALERASAPDPAREAERALERAQVRAVLAEMKPAAARLLVLRHSGLAYAELADALDLAPGSVGTLLARAERDFEKRYHQLFGGSHAPF